MTCPKHPQAEAVAYCGHCGRALCVDCKKEVRGTAYCEDCLAARLTGTGLPPILGQGPSPGLALALSIVPGVGAAYTGQVVKGLLQLVIFVTLWALAQRVDAFGWAVAAWWIYTGVDAYQTAKRKQQGLPAQEWFGLGESDMKLGVPVGAAVLIGLGLMFLLDNLGVPVFRQVGKFWPVLLIAVGLILLQRRLGGGQAKHPASPESPAGDKNWPGNLPGPPGT
jgi:TM2 domain-containing membrane protein YozV